MSCVLRGYAYGVVCAPLQVLDALVGARVVAVPTRDRPVGGGVAAAEALKPKLGELSAERFEAIASEGFSGKVDARGQFCLQGKAPYEGGAVAVYVAVDQVPYTRDGQAASAALDTPVFVFAGVYAPTQSRAGDWLIAYVPSSLWCSIKRRADVWTIAGTVKTPSAAPVTGAVVRAFDTDMTQDDGLGVATTTSAGLFRIDYLGSAFRKGTWLDIELIGGPDVFFTVADGDGDYLIEEKRAVGRSLGRENVGPCLCVELVTPEAAGTDWGPSAWTGVGSAFTIPDATSLNDFDADGYASDGSYAAYALTGTVNLTGAVPWKSETGDPLQYRFLVSTSPTTNGVGAAAPPNGTFDRIVRALPGPGLHVGNLQRSSPVETVKVFVKEGHVDAEGWVNLVAAVNEAFVLDPDLDPADLGTGTWEWIPQGPLLRLDTAEFTKDGHTTIAVRFEVRADTSGGLVTLPGSGMTLHAMKIDNTGVVANINHVVAAGGSSCDPLHTVPRIAWDISHPHLRTVNVSVSNNDNSYGMPLPGAGIPLTNNADKTITSLGSPAGGTALTVPMGGLPRCVYTATMSYAIGTHNGDYATPVGPKSASFYYEP